MQADLKTIAAHGLVGLSCIAAVTAQSEKELRASEATSTELVQAQLEVLFHAYTIDAVKSGLLPNNGCVRAVRRALEINRPAVFVADPVVATSSGFQLVDEDALSALIEELFPVSTLVTPNKHEAEILTDVKIRSEIDALAAAKSLIDMGCSNVLMKGGHFEFSPGVDILVRRTDIDHPIRIAGKYYSDRSVRGTGCTYATAIACALTRTSDLELAVKTAKRYVTAVIRDAYEVNPGHWLPNHFAELG